MFGNEQALREHDLIEQARADEREQCCKDICPDCASGIPVELVIFNDGSREYKHRIRIGHLELWRCHADAIRQRAAGQNK